MRTKMVETGRYPVTGDGGRRDVVYEYTPYTLYETLESGGKWVDGLKEFKLANGNRCNFIDAKTFKVVRTDEVLTRI